MKKIQLFAFGFAVCMISNVFAMQPGSRLLALSNARMRITTNAKAFSPNRAFWSGKFEQYSRVQLRPTGWSIPFITCKDTVKMYAFPTELEFFKKVLKEFEGWHIDWLATGKYLCDEPTLKEHPQIREALLEFIAKQPDVVKPVFYNQNDQPIYPISSWEHMVAKIAPGGLSSAMAVKEKLAMTIAQSVSEQQMFDEAESKDNIHPQSCSVFANCPGCIACSLRNPFE